MRIRYDKINRFIKIHSGIRYLVLIDDLCDKICYRIKYLISEKSGVTKSINHNFARIKIDSYNLYALNQLLIKIKITATIIYFEILYFYCYNILRFV